MHNWKKDSHKVAIVADMGFTDTNLMRFLRNDLGYGFVIRITSNIYVSEDGVNSAPAYSYAPNDGSVRTIENGLITHNFFELKSILISRKPVSTGNSKHEYLCLASTENFLGTPDICSCRFSCEETFRDIKDARHGFDMGQNWMKSPERKDELLFLVSVALFLTENIAERAQNSTVIQGMQQNSTHKKRVFSLRSIGFRIYRILNAGIYAIFSCFSGKLSVLLGIPVKPCSLTVGHPEMLKCASEN